MSSFKTELNRKGSCRWYISVHVETVKATNYGTQGNLLYRRWVEHCTKKVEELPGGRIAYIHTKSMDSPSFHKICSELLNRYRNKEAIVVNTRHNGDGQLHDNVVTLFSGRRYQCLVPCGQYIGNDLFNEQLKTSCMPTYGDNYSNAYGTPCVYKVLGIGRLVDAPVTGTMTAVWWERQTGPPIVLGIPRMGCIDVQGNYLGNQTLQPGILAYSEPTASLKEEGVQLEAAISYLSEGLPKRK